VAREDNFLCDVRGNAVTFADAKQRFSSRVADYARYRPGYPSAVIDLLGAEWGLQPEHAVADIGSGTGFLSELFLKNGNRVFGVEPNLEMRQAGEEYLANYPNFTSINGSAEAAALPDACVDFIAAGQAFHWFEQQAARREFARILKSRGWVVVIWNDRRMAESGFGRDYENLLVRYCTDYTRIKGAYPQTHNVRAFFGERQFQVRELPNGQEFDFDGLLGRLCSSSYAPQEGHPNFVPMRRELRGIFDQYQKNGRVSMEYKTHIFFGQLDGKSG
jgi:SAM-dependent methyltransferase